MGVYVFWDRFLLAILKTEENFVVFAFEHEMRREEKTQNKRNEKKLSVKVLCKI